jgi:hypothetical protein
MTDDRGVWDERMPVVDDALVRAALADSPEGRAIASGFVALFGSFVADQVRPVLRDVAADGGEPQHLVNGLAQLLREVADSIEMAPDAPRGGSAARRDGATG